MSGAEARSAGFVVIPGRRARSARRPGAVEATHTSVESRMRRVRGISNDLNNRSSPNNRTESRQITELSKKFRIFAT